MPYEPFKPDRIKPMDLLKNLKREYVEENQWLPIEDTKEGLIVLCLDPERIRSSRIVSNVFPKSQDRLPRHHAEGVQGDGQPVLRRRGRRTPATSATCCPAWTTRTRGRWTRRRRDDVSAAADNELVKLVNKVIIDAYNQGASDIHIEPYPGKAKTEIRFRKDGVAGALHRGAGELPQRASSARLKIMCDLDISEKRKPQDGKIKFKKFGPLDIELRVATIPTAGRRRGHRDADPRRRRADPAGQAGLHAAQPGASSRSAVSKPYGLFFVCGPTGSGKTTTLHSVLEYLNTPDTKIWTAEDPVEITQKGLRQVQVNKKAGLDFAVVMKAFLRADPDIIMVGEMRDKETTAIGIEASLTGHLVFATLHTNSRAGVDHPPARHGHGPVQLLRRAARHPGAAPGQAPVQAASRPTRRTPPRSSSFLQRVLRRAAEHADASRRTRRRAMEGVYKDWVKNYGNDKGQFTFYKPVGCDKCGGTGYKGRCGLHELLIAHRRAEEADPGARARRRDAGRRRWRRACAP